MTRSNRPVLLVEDHALLAQTLQLAMRAEGIPALVIGIDLLDLVGTLLDHAPAIVLLDLQLGTFGSSEGLIAPLTSHGCVVIVLTGEVDRARWGRCLLAGAHAVVAKTEPLDRIIDAVRAARAGLPIMDERQRIEALRASDHERLADHERSAPFMRLSVREQQVLHALVEGHPVATIAGSSRVSQSTVRTQIRAILTKLGVRSQLQAVALARRVGWPDDSPQGSDVSVSRPQAG